MADGVFNIAKGKINEYLARVAGNDPANSAIILVLLTSTGIEADATLEDYDTLAAILASTNTECTATNYARITLTDTDLTAPSPDDTNNYQQGFLADQTWSSLGGATNNTLAKLLVCYDSDTTGGTDSNIIPLTHHDFSITTNGGDITMDEGANGFYRAA